MAASVYATPPPDLSGEETALSDVSNSSQTNSSNHSQSKKRAVSTTSFLSNSTSPSAITTCTIADGAESKKRRKQTTPIRISSTVGNTGEIENTKNNDNLDSNYQEISKNYEIVDETKTDAIPVIDAEDAIKLLRKQEEDKEDGSSPNLVKKEILEWDGEIKRKFITKPEDWLQLAGLPFPFPPEAASYLPQLPLLGVPPVPSFNGDGSQRSNMPRIFNPEAYCDLCNKEFCNKYFLKTHKANKHGIYEPPVSSADLPNVNLSPMQFSQLLFQQQQHQTHLQSQLQLQSQSQPEGAQTLTEPSVYCDICLKKFNNVLVMRKHRAKVHEQRNGTSEGNDHDESIKLPEGFREDYSIEQEDVSFTPQPRKLSPVSIQQARDANFAVDKLKRLGVMNPEAFCSLCCKEYCNKYFLRTHKLKRHGIIPPPDELKEDRPAWHTIQTSPLNLIMGEIKAVVDDTKEVAKIEISEDDDCEKNSASISPSHNGTEAISVSLQKLQSMIMLMNDQNAQNAVNCGICNKQLENHYMLHAHMMSEHSLENNNQNCMENEICKMCEKEFPNSSLLKQHNIEVHGDSSPESEGFVAPERPPLGIGGMAVMQNDRRPAYTMAPTSSYCEICNKELCNKYFMKTHMQRMHGIEIEHGAQIGGVVCNVCNKELCSKYFLRVHKHNTHGIVDDGSPLAQTRSQNSDSMDGDSFPSSASIDSNMKPGEVSDNRYFSHFTEVCSLCNRRFRSPKWLKAHLMSDHGKAGTDKLRELEAKQNNFIKPTSPALKIPNGVFGLPSPDQNLLSKSALSIFDNGPSKLFFNQDNTAGSSVPKCYQCSYCPFTTSVLPFLFIHERTHSTSAHNQSETAASPAKERGALKPQSIVPSETPISPPASTPIPAQEPIIRSPELNILNEMASMTQRPAAYALPQEVGPYVMQSFFVEHKSDDSRFVPVIVFLPVKERVLSPVTVSFTLTPA